MVIEIKSWPFPGLLFADYLVIRCHMVRHTGSVIEETINKIFLVGGIVKEQYDCGTNYVYEIS